MGLHYGRDHTIYTIHRLGVMAQTAEKMLLKIMNEWLCNVQLFPKVWILEISIKAFRISGSVSGSRLKAVYGYPYPIANSLSCGYPTGKPGSDHLCSVDSERREVNFVGKHFPISLRPFFPIITVARFRSVFFRNRIFGVRSGGIMRFFWIRSRIGYHFCSSPIRIIQNVLNTF